MLYFTIYTEPDNINNNNNGNVDIILVDPNLHLLNNGAAQMQHMQSQIAPARNHLNDQIVSNNNVNNTLSTNVINQPTTEKYHLQDIIQQQQQRSSAIQQSSQSLPHSQPQLPHYSLFQNVPIPNMSNAAKSVYCQQQQQVPQNVNVNVNNNVQNVQSMNMSNMTQMTPNMNTPFLSQNNIANKATTASNICIINQRPHTLNLHPLTINNVNLNHPNNQIQIPPPISVISCSSSINSSMSQCPSLQPSQSPQSPVSPIPSHALCHNDGQCQMKKKFQCHICCKVSYIYIMYYTLHSDCIGIIAIKR